MLELKSVAKRYAGHTVLQPLDLVVEPGEVQVLLGTSGCGKSTILRLMIGLIAPSQGEVWFDGRPLAKQNLTSVRHRMGYVLQDGGLFPHLTARRNVTLLAEYLGWPREQIAGRVTELAQLTHLAQSKLDRFPSRLSGGERQRVSLMRALMLDPDVMLMDEPLGALDPITRADLQRDLRTIFRQLGKTVVIVTHDISEAAYLGNHVLLLRAGQVVQRGTMRDLLTDPADPFVTEFVNSQRLAAELLS